VQANSIITLVWLLSSSWCLSANRRFGGTTKRSGSRGLPQLLDRSHPCGLANCRDAAQHFRQVRVFLAEFRCAGVLPLPVAILETYRSFCLDHDRLGLKGGEGLPLQQLHILRRLTNDRFLAIDLRASTEAAGKRSWAKKRHDPRSDALRRSPPPRQCI